MHTINATDYCDVARRARELGLNAPSGLAFLPKNFDTAKSASDLRHDGMLSTFRVVLRTGGVEEAKLEPPELRIPEVQENSLTLAVPLLFVGAAVLTDHPHVVALALNAIANYVHDFFKGISPPGKVRLSLAVERRGKSISARVDFEGPASEMKASVPAILEALKNASS